jgi:hypothetical protein
MSFQGKVTRLKRKVHDATAPTHWAEGMNFDPDLVESFVDVDLQTELRAGKVQFPHCDSGVLHAPNECEYCDHHPEWQYLRHIWGINFTGHKDPSKIQCPAERVRPLDTIEGWGGNVPTNGRPVDPKEIAATTERLLALLEQLQALSSDLPDQGS